MIVEFNVPIRVESVNRTRNRHWAVRYKERNMQREAINACWLTQVRPHQRLAIKRAASNGLNVRFTRIGPGKLDPDNIVAAMKAATDCMADILHVDDADPRVIYQYESKRGKRGEYWLIVRVATRHVA